jgi:hypothetical protein
LLRSKMSTGISLPWPSRALPILKAHSMRATFRKMLLFAS